MSFLRMISDKTYTKDLRKSNNGMRWVNHVKGRNTIMSNLEWVENKFLEKPPESQPKMSEHERHDRGNEEVQEQPLQV